MNKTADTLRSDRSQDQLVVSVMYMLLILVTTGGKSIAKIARNLDGIVPALMIASLRQMCCPFWEYQGTVLIMTLNLLG